MKTKNQTEQELLELAVTKAANDDGSSAADLREGIAAVRKQAWSPFEVWRTRVKTPAPAQSQRVKPNLERSPGSCAATAEHIQSTLLPERVFAGSRSLAPMKTSSPNRTDAARLLRQRLPPAAFP